MITEADVAWAAGLFEGEGCITVTDGRVTLRLASTDYEVVERFLRVVEAGKLYGPYTRGYRDGFHRRPRWVWVGDRRGAVERILADFAPWLGTRRRARARELGVFM